MIYIVYVLQSIDGKKYTGYTRDIARRLEQHNCGLTKSTKGRRWNVVFTREFDNKSSAILYERYLKTGKGREFLKTQGII
ncbi:MAG: GIY-YIG nuclease family protein [Patescibacteria group bacterium]